jgi:DNA-binding transcriptional LysR family regulator
MIQNEEAITQEVALHKGLVTGRLRVAVFKSVAYHLMPPLMKRLEETYPGLEILMLELTDVWFIGPLSIRVNSL